MKKKALLRQIQNLETETETRVKVVLALAHQIKPTNAFRYNYLIYAVNQRFTAKEFHGIDKFWRDVCHWNDCDALKTFHPITRQAVLDKFDERIPTRAGKLEEILAVDRVDGENGVFHLLSRIVLDRDPAYAEEEADVVHENGTQIFKQEISTP